MTTPHLLLPVILFPLLLFAAFVGSASAVGKAPNFNYYNYTAFQFVYVLIQSAATSGVQTGLAVASDFEGGFARRMMLALPRRSAVLVGYILAGLVQQALLSLVLLVVALASGMTLKGNPLQLLGVFALARLFNIVAALYASGVGLRARTVQIGPAMQIPMLMPLFFAPVLAPRPLLQHWLRVISNWNPVTFFLEAGRGLLAGKPANVAVAFSLLAGLSLIFAVWAATGLRRAEQTA